MTTVYVTDNDNEPRDLKEQITTYVAEAGPVSAKAIAEYTGQSRERMRRVLHGLRNSGAVQMVGAKRGAKYVAPR